MRNLAAAAVVLIALGFGVFWFLTAPRMFDATVLPNHSPDLANGERMFWAGGCKSCHSKAKGKAENRLELGGGDGLVTPFGTFFAPNISPDRENGIGAWSLIEFINAMKLGVAPDGSHLYPAFPYTSYQRMRLEDLIDLKAYLDTLQPVGGRAPDHRLSFPFNVRRGLGLWKLLYVDGEAFRPDPEQDDIVNRGAYLVNGPGHCGECHTSRNVIGGPENAVRLAGGPSPEGKGSIPNITPHKDAIGSWTEDDIVFFLSNGMTPDFEAVGGSMRGVQENLSKLDSTDQLAIARFLKSVTPIAPQPN